MQRCIVAFSAGPRWRRSRAGATRVEVLRSIGGLPAHIAGAFRGADRLPAGRHRRCTSSSIAAATRSTRSTDGGPAQKIVEIGAEAGRVLDPTRVRLDPRDGSFVVADAPNSRERIQIFTPAAAGSAASRCQDASCRG